MSNTQINIILKFAIRLKSISKTMPPIKLFDYSFPLALNTNQLYLFTQSYLKTEFLAEDI